MAARNLLILSPSGYGSVRARGTGHLLPLANPYFRRVFFVNPFGTEKNVVLVGGGNMVMVDFPCPAPWLPRSLSFLLAWIVGICKLRLLIRDHGITMIRAMEPHKTGTMAAVLSWLTGVPFIQDVRANFDLLHRLTGRCVFLPRWIARRVERFVYRRAAQVWGGNVNNRDGAVYCGADPRRAVVSRVNIDPEMFVLPDDRRDLREDLGLTGKRLVLFVGRLSPEKYPGDVLSAFILADLPKLVLLIVGDGPMRGELEQTAAPLGDRVRFLGYGTNRFLRDLYGTVDVVVCPLSGSVLAEAALAGCYIVAYDIEWHSELIVNGYSGFLVDFGDVLGLAQAVDTATYDIGFIGMRARSMALSLFSPETILAREARLYGKAASINDNQR